MPEQANLKRTADATEGAWKEANRAEFSLWLPELE
jgi:hypothetical protein